MTPQLLPAVVSTSLAVGTRRLARRQVLVKRLVCIEDLGDMDVLMTDKTGTLTDGRITLAGALAPDGTPDQWPALLGLLATDNDPASSSSVEAAGSPMDLALAQAPNAPHADARTYQRLGLLPFDHERRMTSVLVRRPDGTLLTVTKGAPEAVVARCRDVPAAAAATMRRQFAAGMRLVAVATPWWQAMSPRAGWPTRTSRTSSWPGSLPSWTRPRTPPAPRWPGWPSSASR
jgi:P-type Mg2+ transporter